ncbi:YggS family pyridoxal phosphate-dependent enzyme [Massilimaliae timonensis]|uniref:Pyridoxal phosphate homeostasis protein n=2 Tax=Massiliimalia timonensis TaxID=1987501 RepID=A0A8J6PDZ4_9FIRM|nr:YggS family pyridoxal phosphate-dependent enzyme [Massiliimalia timonensis]MBS7176886.1 YggS family pyridoxal phosphate-dependent enzyme [Clostridiales bacterium]
MMGNQCSPEEIRENIKRIRSRLGEAFIKSGRSPQEVRVMAVTKTVPAELVNVAIQEGIDLLGENRVQEFQSKRESYDLRKAEVHFIGHLQTNKVKYLADTVTMIESVSSYKLAEEIDRIMGKKQKKMPVLLEVNIGNEESKSGFEPNNLVENLEKLSKLSNISIKGLMCIPPKGESEKFFYNIQKLFVDIKGKKLDNIDMSVLSMGMSADFEQAIQYGSNIVRLGTVLFGHRNYQN